MDIINREVVKKLYKNIAEMKTYSSGAQVCAGRYMSVAEECFLQCAMSLAFITENVKPNVNFSKLYSQIIVNGMSKSFGANSIEGSSMKIGEVFDGLECRQDFLECYNRRDEDFNLESGIYSDIKKLIKDEFSCYPKLRKYYFDMLKLCKTERIGWVKKGLAFERVESVAEHMFSSAFLAKVFYDENNLYGLDLPKILNMLLLHEVGDVNLHSSMRVGNGDIGKKIVTEQQAQHKVLEVLENGDKLYNIYAEYEKNKVVEAKFARNLDKLDGLLQASFYQEKIMEKRRLNSLANQ